MEEAMLLKTQCNWDRILNRMLEGNTQVIVLQATYLKNKILAIANRGGKKKTWFGDDKFLCYCTDGANSKGGVRMIELC